MTPPADNSVTEEPKVRRLAILEMAGDPTPVILTHKESPDGKVEISAKGPSQDVIDRVKAPLVASGDSRSFDAVSRALEDGGFQVQEIPAADQSINVEFDMKTWRATGKAETLNPYAGGDVGLINRVFEAVAGSMKQGAIDLTLRIREAQTAGGPVAAAAAAIKGQEDGLFGFPPSNDLLDALAAVDVAVLSPDMRKRVRELRLATGHQLNRFDVASEEAAQLLSEYGADFGEREKLQLENTIAVGAVKRGRKETALSIWRRLLKPPSVPEAPDRGWIWRNIAMTLDADNPERRIAAKHSADAFLEAGQKDEAARSLMMLVDALMRIDPKEAIKAIDEIMALNEKGGLRNTAVRAATHHARANRLSALGEHAAAADDAKKAVELTRGLLGQEAELVSSLHLAAIELKRLGRDEEAKPFEDEAEKLGNEIKSPRFRFGNRLSALLASFDRDDAEALLKDAEADGDIDVVSGVRIAQAMHDPSLADAQRLEILESSLETQAHAGVSQDRMHPTRLALASLLRQSKQYDRAEHWYRLLLSTNPLDFNAFSGLIDCLWRQEAWGDAAIALKKQIELVGDKPGLLSAYGRSLFEAGDMSGAVTALTKVAALVREPEKAKVMELRERALQLGGTVQPPEPPKQKTSSVTTTEFEAALSDFTKFISAEKRMAFWQKGDTDHEWIARPENLGQNLLHTFFKARFEERVNVFNEIAAGAGRIDLFVQLAGGLSVVVELKMCGFGYSTNYAVSGEDQVVHYMENKATHLGYLVVFDARLTNNGGKLLPSRPADSDTVIEKAIDVRPRVKK